MHPNALLRDSGWLCCSAGLATPSHKKDGQADLRARCAPVIVCDKQGGDSLLTGSLRDYEPRGEKNASLIPNSGLQINHNAAPLGRISQLFG